MATFALDACSAAGRVRNPHSIAALLSGKGVRHEVRRDYSVRPALDLRRGFASVAVQPGMGVCASHPDWYRPRRSSRDDLARAGARVGILVIPARATSRDGLPVDGNLSLGRCRCNGLRVSYRARTRTHAPASHRKFAHGRASALKVTWSVERMSSRSVTHLLAGRQEFSERGAMRPGKRPRSNISCTRKRHRTRAPPRDRSPCRRTGTRRHPRSGCRRSCALDALALTHRNT